MTFYTTGLKVEKYLPFFFIQQPPVWLAIPRKVYLIWAVLVSQLQIKFITAVPIWPILLSASMALRLLFQSPPGQAPKASILNCDFLSFYVLVDPLISLSFMETSNKSTEVI
jgi:hypothetical protein